MSEERERIMGIDWIPDPSTKELPKGHGLAEAYSKYIIQLSKISWRLIR